MKLLSIDPGAERMGWACLEFGRVQPVRGFPEVRSEQVFKYAPPVYHGSGILGQAKGDDKDQDYKVDLIANLIEPVTALLEYHNPDVVVNEIVPSVGSGNFAVSGQGYLANTAIVVVNVLSILAGARIDQIAATTMQRRVARRPEKKTKKITKVQIRNGVIDVFPHIEDRAKSMVADESDAIAIGLAWLDTQHPGLLDGLKDIKDEQNRISP